MICGVGRANGSHERAPDDKLRMPTYDLFFTSISLAAIKPPPAIRTAAIARLALGLAKPAMIRNPVESSGVA